MFLPFEIMRIEYINQLIRLKKIYLVAQSYNMGEDPFEHTDKIGLIVSDYDDPGLAKIHLAAVKQDKYASIINLSNEIHQAKITEMLLPDSAYAVYWAIVKDAEQFKRKVDAQFSDHIRRYIAKNTNWSIGGSATLRPQLQVIFGELFVILKYGSHELRIKFTDVEKS